MLSGEMIGLISGLSAVIGASATQIMLWILNRRAVKEDRAGERKDRSEMKVSHIEKALRVILYDRIKYLCRHHIGEGFITVEDFEDLMAMHKCYHDDLNGNGFLDSLMERVKALETRKS